MKWIEVSVRVMPSRVEAAGDLLLRHCPAGVAEITEGRRRVLRAYLPSSASGRRSAAALARALAPLASHAGTRVVTDAGWARAWGEGARPVHLGRLTVQPRGSPYRPGRGRVVVRLDPGMAFGSGEHPTTQLCLRAVERYVRPGITVVDLGTGSGILTIAAARLGAARVLAIDNDPVAVQVARANVRANRVADRVTVRRGEGLYGVRISAGLMLANLTADILPSVLRDAVRCLAPGGRLVACGFGSPRVSEVRTRLRAAGLSVVGTERLRGWCAVHAVAGGAPRAGRDRTRARGARAGRPHVRGSRADRAARQRGRGGR
ncbi:MAG: 50S ribosomal protein L11 methyltransferase [Armatimonadetes bacterium]|nr:50S ribosomal protein L11 methyltransferase [Armatimonadota bacterium]